MIIFTMLSMKLCDYVIYSALIFHLHIHMIIQWFKFSLFPFSVSLCKILEVIQRSHCNYVSYMHTYYIWYPSFIFTLYFCGIAWVTAAYTISVAILLLYSIWLLWLVNWNLVLIVLKDKILGYTIFLNLIPTRLEESTAIFLTSNWD